MLQVLESDQRNMPHWRYPKQVPQKNSIFWQDNQCGGPTGMLPISEVKKRRWRWRKDIYSKNSHALDPRRKQEERTTKRDVEKVRGARDEGSRVELGPGRKAGSGQTAFLGVGLMCEHARRGLSK